MRPSFKCENRGLTVTIFFLLFVIYFLYLMGKIYGASVTRKRVKDLRKIVSIKLVSDI